MELNVVQAFLRLSTCPGLDGSNQPNPTQPNPTQPNQIDGIGIDALVSPHLCRESIQGIWSTTSCNRNTSQEPRMPNSIRIGTVLPVPVSLMYVAVLQSIDRACKCVVAEPLVVAYNLQGSMKRACSVSLARPPTCKTPNKSSPKVRSICTQHTQPCNTCTEVVVVVVVVLVVKDTDTQPIQQRST
jgi:hypothetical protein